MTRTDEIAGNIDNEGLWYWIWQKFYTEYKDDIDPELYSNLESLSIYMENIRKVMEDKGYLF
jgi:hypothetical protein